MEKEGKKTVTLHYGVYTLWNQRLVLAGACCKEACSSCCPDTSFTGRGLQSKGEGSGGDINHEER